MSFDFFPSVSSTGVHYLWTTVGIGGTSGGVRGREAVVLTTGERPNTLERVTNSGAGEAIKKRRTALGVTVKALAEKAGVDRGRLAAIEDGASARESTIGAIERALADLEAAMSGPYDDDGERGLVTFRMSGSFGVDVVVQGPVENLDELERSVERLIQRMRTQDSGE